MLENKCKYYAQIFGGVINTAYLCPIIHTKKCDKMKNAVLKITNQGDAKMFFFNSKEVYSTERFNTERAAKNYAKKYGYTLFSELPEGVEYFPQSN